MASAKRYGHSFSGMDTHCAGCGYCGTGAQCETALRAFCGFHLRTRTDGRYRPRVPEPVPRRIPDGTYTEVFAGLRSDRDGALPAFCVSTGARSGELVSFGQRDAVLGQQPLGVIRAGTREYQRLPASPDAFVWLRLCPEDAWKKGVLPPGRGEPLWRTLRRPWRPLSCHAARAVFVRANEVPGCDGNLHGLRHTASFPMAEAPDSQLRQVQYILGHRGG